MEAQATTNTIQWEPTYKTPYNANKWPKDHEKNYAPSMTVPDQSMSIKEIMDRHAKGLPIIGNGNVPMYEDETTGILWPADWEKMDISEKQEYMEQAAKEIVQIREKHKKQKEKEYYDAAETYYRKKFEDEQQSKPQVSDAGGDSNKQE